uniref:Uncharacterized protein n=1 Tax=Siphoviridae sp. ctkKt3 TaxID=2825642 RepID=A0A8S5UZ60_9CAUD|nr:MAG TPA: hypothetical protein [Siphoviridae sp. ctkKt3]
MIMYNYTLTKPEKKTLRRMRGKTSVPEAEIYNCRGLYEKNFIQQNHTSETDGFGQPLHDGTYCLSDNYWRYVESTRWFNTEYVVSHILVPITVSLLTFLITGLLSGVISLPG